MQSKQLTDAIKEVFDRWDLNLPRTVRKELLDALCMKHQLTGDDRALLTTIAAQLNDDVLGQPPAMDNASLYKAASNVVHKV